MNNSISTVTQANAPVKRPPTITDYLGSPALKGQLQTVLPTYLTPDRMVRIALTELRNNPKLLECEPLSFVGSVIRCAQMGLEPSTEKGHVFLIPFFNGKTKRSECKVMVGYKGMLHLAAKSGVHCEPGVVYSEDFFEMEHGLEPKFKHRPNLDKRGEFKGVYVVYRFFNNPSMTPMFAYMAKAEIDEAKERALKDKKYSTGGPWDTDYIAMGVKTLIRRSIKYCPMSDELQYAVSSDELADVDIQNNAGLVDIPMADPVEKPADKPVAELLNDDVE